LVGGGLPHHWLEGLLVRVFCFLYLIVTVKVTANLWM
jgi:hypothetical protein